jgi:hypothetical protein
VVEIKARERSQIGHLSSERNAEVGREGQPDALRLSVTGH